MATTGDVGSALSAVLTHPYVRADIEERVAYRNVLYNLLSRDIRSIGGVVMGDYIKLGRYATARQVIAGGRAEAQDVRLPGTTTMAFATLYPKQIMGSIGWTQERLEFARDEAGFRALVTDSFLRHVDGVKALLNAIWFGDGTGRLGRVSAYNASTRVVTLDNSQANYGWFAADQMFEGMLIEIHTVADIVGTAAWTRKAIEVVVDQLNKRASATTATFRITARTDSGGNAIAGSAIDPDGKGVPANSDNVFIAGAVVLTSDHKFSSWGLPMGIHGIVDDAQDAGAEFTESGNAYNHCWHGVTVQGLDRSAAANSMFKARVSRGGDRGGTDGTALTTDMADVDLELDYLFQINDGPDPDRLLAFCNAKTKRWWSATAKNEQNGFQNIDDGRVVPGLILNGFRSEAAGGKVIPVITIPTCADGTVIFLDAARCAFWDVFPLGPFMYGGKTQFESPGTRNLTHERWSRYFGNLGFERADTSLRIEDIDIS